MRDVATPLLDVSDASLAYGRLLVVDQMSFSILPGPFGPALIGKSGSGKLTMARGVLGLLMVNSGMIKVAGQDVALLNRAEG